MAFLSHSDVEAVVFDYGGVLTTPVRDATRQWLASDGIDPDSFLAIMRAWMGRDAAPGSPVHRLETGELSGPEFETVLAQQLRTIDGRPLAAAGLLARMFAEMRPDPRMFALPRDLASAGIRTAILSNSWANTYPADLASLVDVVVISGQVGQRKPDPGIYQLTLDRLGLPAARCVFVDDLPANVRAAENLGMRAVRHTDAVTTRAALTDLIPGLAQVRV